MFKKKATAEQLEGLSGLMGSENRNIWNRIRALEADHEALSNLQSDMENRLLRYSKRLTIIINELAATRFVVDSNATESEKDRAALKEAYARLEEVKTGISLLASEIGRELTVLPAVEPTVTVQPGLPERLGLVKAVKGELMRELQELPTPIELQVGSDGIHLVQQ